MSDERAVAMGCLPIIHAADQAQYPTLYEENAVKEMGEGYAYRYKVRPKPIL